MKFRKINLTIIFFVMADIALSQSFTPNMLIGKWQSIRNNDTMVITFGDSANAFMISKPHNDSVSSYPMAYKIDSFHSPNFEIRFAPRNEPEGLLNAEPNSCTIINNDSFQMEVGHYTDKLHNIDKRVIATFSRLK